MSTTKQRVQFYPRVLLAEIVAIFLHLSDSARFLEAVASDERSYKADVFAKTAATLRRKRIMSERDCAKFEQLLTTLEQIAKVKRETEDILGDIPDKYLDALLSTLMTDPVTLPQSKCNVDRTTIRRHLMNNPKDPFTRSPLTMEMVITNTALKTEIEEWVAAKRAERRAASLAKVFATAAAAVTAIDQSSNNPSATTNNAVVKDGGSKSDTGTGSIVPASPPTSNNPTSTASTSDQRTLPTSVTPPPRAP